MKMKEWFNGLTNKFTKINNLNNEYDNISEMFTWLLNSLDNLKSLEIFNEAEINEIIDILNKVKDKIENKFLEGANIIRDELFSALNNIVDIKNKEGQ